MQHRIFGRLILIGIILAVLSAANQALAQGKIRSFPYTSTPETGPAAQADTNGGGRRTLRLARHLDSINYRSTSVTAFGSTFLSINRNLGQVEWYQLTESVPALIRTFGVGVGYGQGQLNTPIMATMSDDKVFVTDYHAHWISVFDKNTGNFIYRFGGFGVDPGKLSFPTTIAFNPINSLLYIIEEANYRISVFNTDGEFQSFLEVSTSQLNPGRVGLAVDRYGNVYTGSQRYQSISKFNLAGVLENNIALIETPVSVAIDDSDLLWVGTNDNNINAYDQEGNLRIQFKGDGYSKLGYSFSPGSLVVTTPLAISPFNGSRSILVASSNSGIDMFEVTYHPFSHPLIEYGTGFSNFIGGVASDSAENLYVTDSLADKVYKFDKFGYLLTSWGATGTGNGQFDVPFGITTDDDNNVYVADYFNHRIQKFNSNGVFITLWHGVERNELYYPADIDFDGTFLYVADEGNDRVVKFETGGGSGAALTSWPFLLRSPAGIAIDRARKLMYISEFGGNVIAVYTTDGVYTGAIADSSAGNIAAVNQPVGITVDQRGNIYVADRGNHRVIQFDHQWKYAATISTPGANSVHINPKNNQLFVGGAGTGILARYGSPIQKFDTLGVWRPGNRTFYLRNSNTTGIATFNSQVTGALSTDLPIVGDWNGDGIDTPGLFRSSEAQLYAWDSWANPNINTPHYRVFLGNPGDTPLAGDWNGDGTDAFGVFRPSNGILYLKNGRISGFADHFMILGNPSDKGVAGDWNGDGNDSAGIYRSSEARFYLSDQIGGGVVYADYKVFLGDAGDTPFTGQWTGEGHTGLGVFRPTNGFLYLKYQLTNGFADVGIFYGAPGDVGLGGVWGPTPTAPDGAPTKPIKPPNVLVAGPITAGSTPVNTVDGPEDKFD